MQSGRSFAVPERTISELKRFASDQDRSSAARGEQRARERERELARAKNRKHVIGSSRIKKCLKQKEV